VKLSSRYITDRQFPDKAIDVLDELGSEKRVSSKIPESIEKLKREIDEITKRMSMDYELPPYDFIG
jgi:ATP-dependent Clp protease ATP-binding subunit ClpA